MATELFLELLLFKSLMYANVAYNRGGQSQSFRHIQLTAVKTLTLIFRSHAAYMYLCYSKV